MVDMVDRLVITNTDTHLLTFAADSSSHALCLVYVFSRLPFDLI